MNTFRRLFTGLLLITLTGISCNQQSPAESSVDSEHPEHPTSISTPTPSQLLRQRGKS